jgi:hypothetical protein
MTIFLLSWEFTHTSPMKNLSLLAAFSFVVLFAACKKDEDKPATPTTSPYYIKWKMGGTEYTGNFSKATDYDADIEFGATITYDGKPMGISVYLSGYTGVKTYTGGPLGASMTFGDGATYYTSASSTPVTVKVTEDNGTEFKGEFNGKLFANDTTKTLTVTDGTFSLKKPGK